MRAVTHPFFLPEILSREFFSAQWIGHRAGAAALYTENIFVTFCIQNRVTTTKFMMCYMVLLNQMATGIFLQASWYVPMGYVVSALLCCWMWMLSTNRQRNVLVNTRSRAMLFQLLFSNSLQTPKPRSNMRPTVADCESTQMDNIVHKTLTYSSSDGPGQGRWDILFLETVWALSSIVSSTK